MFSWQGRRRASPLLFAATKELSSSPPLTAVCLPSTIIRHFDSMWRQIEFRRRRQKGTLNCAFSRQVRPSILHFVTRYRPTQNLSWSRCYKGSSIALRGWNVNVPSSRAASLPAKKIAQTVSQLNRKWHKPNLKEKFKAMPMTIIMLKKIYSYCNSNSDFFGLILYLLSWPHSRRLHKSKWGTAAWV